MLAFVGHAQQRNYSSDMQQFYASIKRNFYLNTGYYKETVQPEKDSRAVSYLWPLCALMQADNEVEKVSQWKDF